VFCGVTVYDLRRHFILKHSEVPKIKDILLRETNGTITRKERIREFDGLKKEGILAENTKILAKASDAMLHCERKSKGVKVICSSCKGFYDKKYFYRHKQKCFATGDNSENSEKLQVQGMPLSVVIEDESDEWQAVCYGMKQDKTHEIIMKDDTIQAVGKQIYMAKKPSKHKESRINARTAMRRLSKLLQHSKLGEAFQMFMVENLQSLLAGISDMCYKESKSSVPSATSRPVKAGLKVALGTLLKLSSRILFCHFTIHKLNVKASMVEQFQKILCTPTFYASIFGEAEYLLKEKRQRENRKPSALPKEENVAKFSLYLEGEIKKISKGPSLENVNKSVYIHIRKVALAYVTFINARRGSEPARLTLKDWEDRHSWIDGKKLKAAHKKLVRRYEIVFVMGKGLELVTVFFPKIMERAINILVDRNVRKTVGVSSSNDFLFAYTSLSEDGTVGYNEIRDICQKVNIPVISATSLRHRASTRLWAMEGVPEDVIRSFMEHIGHKLHIDKNIYSCPPAMRLMQDVTPILERLNEVSLFHLFFMIPECLNKFRYCELSLKFGG